MSIKAVLNEHFVTLLRALLLCINAQLRKCFMLFIMKFMKSKNEKRGLHHISILYDLETHNSFQHALLDDPRYKTITDWYTAQVKKYIKSRTKQQAK